MKRVFLSISISCLPLVVHGSSAMADISPEQAVAKAKSYLSRLKPDAKDWFWPEEFEKVPVIIQEGRDYYHGLKPIQPIGSTKRAYRIEANKYGNDNRYCWASSVWVAADNGRILPIVSFYEVYWDGSSSKELSSDWPTAKQWQCRIYDDGSGGGNIPFP
jgi:hypothetical protein